MILYSVTVSIDRPYEQEWLEWMKGIFLPKMMATGRFVEYKMFRLLNGEDEGATYSIQYFTNTIQELESYLDEDAPALIQEHFQRFKDRHVAFRTMLEQVEI